VAVNTVLREAADVYGLSKRHRDVLWLLARNQRRGLTADEMESRMGVIVHQRVSELEQLGLICDSGRRRQTAHGAPAIVWALNGAVL